MTIYVCSNKKKIMIVYEYNKICCMSNFLLNNFNKGVKGYLDRVRLFW